ncbi:MAG: FkbM family methyltransferase [Ruminococcus sp.]|nr:FkbM family methyltransferase [Ruminococcus sp.]
MMKTIEALLSGLPNIENKRVYIWGAGNTALLFREGLARIPQLKIEAFVDNDPSKHNQCIGNTPIIPADQMIIDSKTFVMICTGQPSAFTAITAQLNEMGVESANIDAAIFGMFREEIKSAYELLDDEESKRVYLGLLESRILCRFPADDLICSEQYFCFPRFRGAAVGETFIDCGAYVGDSVERYIWSHDGVFGKIIAFEPDRKNFRAMNSRMERLKREWNIDEEMISFYPYGVSNEDSTHYMESYSGNNGFGSKMSETKGENSEECRTVTLAPFITDGNCFVKADIESYEYKMLQGAADAIQKHMPKMAICIYHNAVDFFTLPLLVKSICPTYRLSVRHHSATLSETVLYVHI